MTRSFLVDCLQAEESNGDDPEEQNDRDRCQEIFKDSHGYIIETTVRNQDKRKSNDRDYPISRSVPCLRCDLGRQRSRCNDRLLSSLRNTHKATFRKKDLGRSHQGKRTSEDWDRLGCRVLFSCYYIYIRVKV